MRRSHLVVVLIFAMAGCESQEAREDRQLAYLQSQKQIEGTAQPMAECMTRKLAAPAARDIGKASAEGFFETGLPDIDPSANFRPREAPLLIEKATMLVAAACGMDGELLSAYKQWQEKPNGPEPRDDVRRLSYAFASFRERIAALPAYQQGYTPVIEARRAMQKINDRARDQADRERVARDQAWAVAK